MNQTHLDVVAWDEPALENFGPDNAITIARVTYTAKGHLNGTITSTYVIHYTAYDITKPHEAQSTFTGYSVFNGEIDGKQGHVVFIEKGEHSNGLLSKLTIKENTGSDALKNLRGSADYTFTDGKVVLESSFTFI